MSSTFGEKLFALRRSKKLLQKEVASKAGVNSSYLASMERGQRDPPRAKYLDRIAKVVCANESERAELLKLAAVARVQRALEEAATHFEGADQMREILDVMPRLSTTKCEALSAVAQAMLSD